MAEEKKKEEPKKEEAKPEEKPAEEAAEAPRGREEKSGKKKKQKGKKKSKKDKKSQKEKPKSKKKHSKVQVWKKYEAKGNELKRKGEFCPRCGAGTFLAIFKNRKYCGKCGWAQVSEAKGKK